MFCIAMQLNEAVLCLGVPRRFMLLSQIRYLPAARQCLTLISSQSVLVAETRSWQYKAFLYHFILLTQWMCKCIKCNQLVIVGSVVLMLLSAFFFPFMPYSHAFPLPVLHRIFSICSCMSLDFHLILLPECSYLTGSSCTSMYRELFPHYSLGAKHMHGLAEATHPSSLWRRMCTSL